MADTDFSRLPEDRPLSPLPLAATARAALRRLLALAPLIGRLALLPLLISFALGPALAVLGVSSLLLLIASLANLYLLVWFATATLRLALLGPGPTTLGILPRWREPELRVFGRFVGIGLIMLAVAFPATFIVGSFAGAFQGAEPRFGAWMIGPALVAAAAGLGVALTLPAAALGPGYRFARAWRESRGALPTLLGLFVLLVLPIDLAAALLDWLMMKLQVATDLVVPRLAVGVAANYLSLAIACVVLAEVFGRRTGWTAPAPGAT